MAKTIKLTVTTNWNDLTNTQLKKVAKLFFTPQKNEAIQAFRIFKIVSNYKWYKFKLLRKIVTLFKVRTLTKIKQTYSFLFQKQDLTRFIKSVRIGFKKYYAPADRLNNLSIGEFSVCEDLYLGYLRNANKPEVSNTYLQYLFAVLYINNKKSVRPQFQKESLDTLVDHISKVKQTYLLTTLLSYKGCRDAIVKNPKYRAIFPKPKESEQNQPKKALEIPTSSGWSDVILSFSGKLFGDYQKTYNTNLYTFLDAYEKELETINQK